MDKESKLLKSLNAILKLALESKKTCKEENDKRGIAWWGGVISVCKTILEG